MILLIKFIKKHKKDEDFTFKYFSLKKNLEKLKKWGYNDLVFQQKF